jgi:phage gp29-like protein
MLKPAATLYRPVAIEDVLNLLARLPDPDVMLAAKQLGRHELRKLEADDEISAALETRREAVLATPWRLEPYDSEPAAWLWAELAPHIESLLRGAWSAVPYGFSVLEAVYRPPAPGAPRLGLAFVEEKPLEWFEPRRDNSLWYTAPNGGMPVAVDTTAKFLLTRRQPTYRNPYGEALLSRLYWPWFFRHNGWRFWMQFLERFADPLLLGRVPVRGVDAGDDQARLDAWVLGMQGLGFESVVAVPLVDGQGDLTAVTSGAAGEFEKVEAALLARIQRLILGQTLTSQVGASGSYAAAKIHNEVRDDKRRADLRLVTGTVQRLIDALWTLNTLPDAPPTFILQDDQGLETERAARDAQLVEAGVLTLTEQYLLSNYPFEPGDFTLPVAAPAPPVALRAPQIDRSFAARPAQRFTQDQQLVEDLTAAALAQAASPIDAATLRQVIGAADSPADLAERLAALYTGTEAGAFQDLLERALFTADVLGYTTAEQRLGVTL